MKTKQPNIEQFFKSNNISSGDLIGIKAERRFDSYKQRLRFFFDTRPDRNESIMVCMLQFETKEQSAEIKFKTDNRLIFVINVFDICKTQNLSEIIIFENSLLWANPERWISRF